MSRRKRRAMSIDFNRFRPFVDDLDLDEAQKVERIAFVLELVGLIVADAFDRAVSAKACGENAIEGAQAALVAPDYKLNSLEKIFNDAGEGGANDNT